jgi:hypothetical protein
MANDDFFYRPGGASTLTPGYDPIPTIEDWKESMGLTGEWTREDTFGYKNMVRDTKSRHQKLWTLDDEAELQQKHFKWLGNLDLHTDEEKDESVKYGIKIDNLRKEGGANRSPEWHFGILDADLKEHWPENHPIRKNVASFHSLHAAGKLTSDEEPQFFGRQGNKPVMDEETGEQKVKR